MTFRCYTNVKFSHSKCKININEHNLSPLHLAARWNQAKAVKILLDNNASMKIQDSKGNYPLDYAAERGNNECVNT